MKMSLTVSKCLTKAIKYLLMWPKVSASPLQVDLDSTQIFNFVPERLGHTNMNLNTREALHYAKRIIIK